MCKERRYENLDVYSRLLLKVSCFWFKSTFNVQKQNERIYVKLGCYWNFLTGFAFVICSLF